MKKTVYIDSTYPFEDSIIEEKNRIQDEIFSEAKGDLKTYYEIVHREAGKMREKYATLFHEQSGALR